MTSGRNLVEILTLPFKSAQTLYEGSSEVRRYVNEITGVQQIGKRVSKIGLEDALGFKEAQLLQSIRHDHIVPVYDVAVVSEPKQDPLMTIIEMIMPFYERGSVFDALVKNGETFTIGQAVGLTRDFLLGLDELHEKYRLLHRDIKSANVFIDEKGRGRIGDLGVAMPMEADGSADGFQGMQLFTPPETLCKQRADRYTDIYGIGLVLHELLSGPLPYQEYDYSLLQRRLEKGQRPVKDEHLVPQAHVPPRLRTVITKALARNPSDRYATARAMIDALGKARFIDWRRLDNGTWEGAVPDSPEVRYQVSATKMRRPEKWRLTGKKYVHDWRRCVEDHDVTDLADKSVRDFFDQLVTHATSL
jgi:serine/threonine protein kinase